MKYYLSLCVIIKNEDYLEEFIIYYIANGVEHFYLYDNESDIPLKKRLNKPIFKKFCTIIDYPGKCCQMPVYNHCIQKTRNETFWLIIVDGDEYIVPKGKQSLRQFLNDYEDDNCHSLGINWIFFGSSGHKKKPKGLLIDNFTKCQGKKDGTPAVHPLIKTICKPRYVINMPNPHYVNLLNPNKSIDPDRRIISGPLNHNGNNKKIQINHYWGKSLAEYLKKIDRGNADQLNKRTIDPNYIYKYNETKEKTIKKKYLSTVKRILRENKIKIK